MKYSVKEGLEVRQGRRYILLWVFACVVYRGVVLAWGFNRTFYWEETYRLVVARALLEGWPIPLLELQADPYAGGSLVMSFLAAPAVAVFGSSVLVLKWVALLWTAGGLLAWLLLVDKYFGRSAAHFFALCFVFAPPLFVIYNVIAMGSHAEVVTLSGIQFLLAFRYIYGGKRSNLSLLTWAAFAGVNVWFAYVSFLAFFVCVVTGLLSGALPARRWAVMAAGFLVGLLPLFMYNAATGGSGVAVLGTTFAAPTIAGHGRLATYVITLFDLIKAGIPVALRYHDLLWQIGETTLRIPREVFSYLYLAVFAVAWFYCAASCVFEKGLVRDGASRGLRRILNTHPEIPLLMVFPVFVLVIAASNHGFNELGIVPFLSFRILVPALPALFFTMALAASRLSRRPRALAACLLAILGTVGAAQLVAAGAGERPRIERQAQELGAEAMGHLLFYKHGADMPLIAKRIRAIRPELQRSAYRGVGFGLAYHFPPKAPVEVLLKNVLSVDARYRGDLVDGIRLALGPGMEQVRPLPQSPRTQEILAAINALDAVEGAQ